MHLGAGLSFHTEFYSIFKVLVASEGTKTVLWFRVCNDFALLRFGMVMSDSGGLGIPQDHVALPRDDRLRSGSRSLLITGSCIPSSCDCNRPQCRIRIRRLPLACTRVILP